MSALIVTKCLVHLSTKLIVRDSQPPPTGSEECILHHRGKAAQAALQLVHQEGIPPPHACRDQSLVLANKSTEKPGDLQNNLRTSNMPPTELAGGDGEPSQPLLVRWREELVLLKNAFQYGERVVGGCSVQG
jgi:hypothetical protein